LKQNAITLKHLESCRRLRNRSEDQTFFQWMQIRSLANATHRSWQPTVRRQASLYHPSHSKSQWIRALHHYDRVMVTFTIPPPDCPSAGQLLLRFFAIFLHLLLGTLCMSPPGR
jgi:hypothetical protein